MRYQRGSLQRHEQLKYWILAHPESVGISMDAIVSVQTEYPLTKKNRAIAQPDIVITHAAGDGIKTTFIEVKSGHNKHSLHDLSLQVRKIANYLKWKQLSGNVIGVYPCTKTGMLRTITTFSKTTLK